MEKTIDGVTYVFKPMLMESQHEINRAYKKDQDETLMHYRTIVKTLESWSLTDAKGNMLPITVENLEKHVNFRAFMPLVLAASEMNTITVHEKNASSGQSAQG